MDRKRFYGPVRVWRRKKPKWIVAAELVETTRRFLRTAARIDPNWIEPLAGHLLSRTYSEPHWDAENVGVMAFENVMLLGLLIVPRAVASAMGASIPWRRGNCSFSTGWSMGNGAKRSMVPARRRCLTF